MDVLCQGLAIGISKWSPGFSAARLVTMLSSQPHPGPVLAHSRPDALALIPHLAALYPAGLLVTPPLPLFVPAHPPLDSMSPVVGQMH